LRELAKALGNARGMTDKAMQDDVGNHLFSAWWEGTNEPRASVVRNDDGSFALVRIADEMFKDAVWGVSPL
jgi:post-segregation antitoxin (ccd killing protein)